MRELANPIRDLFDAAVRQRNIRLTCRRCGHSAVLSAHALWWLCEREGWRMELAHVARRCVCGQCLARSHRPERSPTLEAVHAPPTDRSLPPPPESEWKRQLRRRR